MSATDRELAEAWFQKAEGDLRGVRIMLAVEDPPLDLVCFHCQQGAEKYLKGFLAWHAMPFQRTHNLTALLTTAATVAPALQQLQHATNLLTVYAVDVRYPAAIAELALDDAREADEAAHAIRGAVRAALGLPDS